MDEYNVGAYTIEEFVEKFSVPRTTVFEQIRLGLLRSYKVGKRRYISAHAAADWQRTLEAQEEERRRMSRA